jgi:4-hydroxymandelate oxidase
MLAPTAAHGLAHDEAEVATARGAGAARTPMVVSTLANTPIERIAPEATSPLWFQLYVQRDRGFTRDLVQRAEDAGARALCVTVDTPVLGTRNREERVGFALSEGLTFPHLEGMGGTDAAAGHGGGDSIYAPILDASLTWAGIEWLRSIARVPVVLKGITAPQDAAIAAREAVDAIIVSNHGARNLDTVPAAIEALPRVVEQVGGACPILMDGGVRRGTDVLKALALGAEAVLIGRPCLHALAADGAAGVARVLEILRRELAMAMALTGCNTVSRIDRSVLWEQ